MSYAAGIVTYDPDPVLLRRNLEHISHQVDAVVVVDNFSSDRASVRELVAAFPTCSVIENPSNAGMAAALNQVMSWADGGSFGSVLLLDQDSVAADDLVTLLVRHVDEQVALVAPRIDDRSVSRGGRVAVQPAHDVNYCITSGSLSSTAAWLQVGGYDEAMFVDFVDFDYCLRLREHGFRIVREEAAELSHQIGEGRRHGSVVAYNHSAFRLYHQARDMLYYARKHRGSPDSLKVNGRGVFVTYLVLVRKAAVIATFERQRVARVSALMRGTISGTFRRR